MSNPFTRGLFECSWIAFVALLSACNGVVEGGGPAQGNASTTGPSNSQSSANCPGGQNACGATCVDLQTDTKNCGDCDQACAGTCSAGKCQCPGGQTSCDGACVQLTAPAHCGSCANACSTGQTCSDGACKCPGTATVCNTLCTDIQTSIDHCGACNSPCDLGQTCSGGKCGCPQGQTICGKKCVDLTQTETDCGMCGKACAAGQSCSGGTCVSSSGTDGCAGAALGVTLKQVAVYQSVKIPVMDAGAEVPSAKRNASVVAGRPTMFRFFPTVDAGFTARDISARITLTNGATVDQYYAKHSLSKSAVETDATTTFEVVVPSDKIAVDTAYHAELVECAKGSGQAGAPRFPATGELPLGVRATGGLKIKVIPILANAKVPDTSDTALNVYRQQMLAMYPIDSVEITVGTQISAAKYPIDWTATLDQLRSKRQMDAPPADVYYFGLLMPEDTLKKFCGNSCTTGVGYVANATSATQRAALGIGFGDRVSAETMAHEVGHNHGRNHSPCVTAGSIAGVDSKYPYAGGIIGSWGYDSRSKGLLVPDKNTDIMGYCNSKWISDYTYAAITERVATVNRALSMYVAEQALSPWRVLLLDNQGPRWGNPVTQPSLPEGDPMLARVLDASGQEIAQIEVYRTEISENGAAMVMVPEPQPGWSSVQVPGFAAHPFDAPIAVPPP